MSKNPQDRNRMPGQGENEEMDMPKKDMDKEKEQGGQSKTGRQDWNREQNQGQSGPHGQRQQGDMNRPKETDEDAGDDRTKRPA
jgi:hypothetical protein